MVIYGENILKRNPIRMVTFRKIKNPLIGNSFRKQRIPKNTGLCMAEAKNATSIQDYIVYNKGIMD